MSFLVIVDRRGGLPPIISLPPDKDPSKEDEQAEAAIRRVLDRNTPLRDGDVIYVIPADQVIIFRAKGQPTIERDVPQPSTHEETLD